MIKDNALFYMFVACFAFLFLVVMHAVQQKRINELQIQIDELKIVTDQKFLPAMILDNTVFGIR